MQNHIRTASDDYKIFALVCKLKDKALLRNKHFSVILLIDIGEGKRAGERKRKG